MDKTTAPHGFRGDIMVLHAISDLMEKNPALPRPKVEFNRGYNGEVRNTIHWHLRTDSDITIPHRNEDDGTWMDWDERTAQLKTLRRVDLEERIAALVLALGPDTEWEKNDPTVEEWAYRLSATWHGCDLSISTWREDVCEKVVVLEKDRFEEQPDPEVVEKLMADVPKVTVKVTDQITEWQCNARLAAATAPKHVRTVQLVS